MGGRSRTSISRNTEIAAVRERAVMLDRVTDFIEDIPAGIELVGNDARKTRRDKDPAV